jgi:hypothetical protein
MAQGSAQNKVQPVDEFKQPVSRLHPLAVADGEGATPGQSVHSAAAPVTQLLQEIRDLLLDIRESVIGVERFSGPQILEKVPKLSKSNTINDRFVR